jgi:acetyltransferase-like isoleucine patch superfamily enzyme
MSRNRGRHRDIPFLPNARDLAKEYARDFFNLLVSQSKLIAHKERVDVVSEVHIDKARQFIEEKRLRSKVWQEFAKILGGACLGRFAWVASEAVFNSGNITVGTAIVGMAGLLLVLLGLRQ